MRKLIAGIYIFICNKQDLIFRIQRGRKNLENANAVRHGLSEMARDVVNWLWQESVLDKLFEIHQKAYANDVLRIS